MLNLDPIVKINLNVGTSTTVANVYDVGLVLGSSKADEEDEDYIIPLEDRVVSFANLAEVEEAGFTESMPEYLAAAKYFGVNPAPRALLIGVIDEDNSETPAQALAAVMQITLDFYGVYVPNATNEQITAIASYLGNINHGVLFYDQTGEPSAAVQSTSILYKQNENGSNRVIGTVCDLYGSAAVMGVAMGLERRYAESAFSLCYKEIRGLNLPAVTETLVNQIKALNGNVYVSRGRNLTLYEVGTTASGDRYDAILYRDEMCDELRNACVSIIASQTTRIPMSDSSNALFSSAISEVLNGFTARGILEEKAFTGSSAYVEEGTVLTNGYLVITRSYDTQTEEDRKAHKAMPITIFVNMTDTVESIELTINVQR